MRTYKLPFDLSELPNITEKTTIEMFDLSFPVSDDQQKNAAFIFLRNANINASFDFSKCSYTDKAEFLSIYMTGKINVFIKPLVTTWINVIGYENIDPHIENILTCDEMQKFCSEYKDLIFEVKRLSVSLPICAITEYRRSNEVDLTNDIDVTNYDKINVNNFLGLTLFEEFNNLVLFITDVSPVMYTKYFNVNSPFYNRIINLPITQLMLMMFNPETSTEFADVLVETFDQSISNDLE